MLVFCLFGITHFANRDFKIRAVHIYWSNFGDQPAFNKPHSHQPPATANQKSTNRFCEIRFFFFFENNKNKNSKRINERVFWKQIFNFVNVKKRKNWKKIDWTNYLSIDKQFKKPKKIIRYRSSIVLSYTLRSINRKSNKSVWIQLIKLKSTKVKVLVTSSVQNSNSHFAGTSVVIPNWHCVDTKLWNLKTVFKSRNQQKNSSWWIKLE